MKNLPYNDPRFRENRATGLLFSSMKQFVVKILIGMALAIPINVYGQPDTVWTSMPAMILLRCNISLFLADDSGFFIACDDALGREPVFSLIKTDSSGFLDWQRFYDTLPDREMSQEFWSACKMPDGGFMMVGDGLVRIDSDFEMIWYRNRLEEGTFGYNVVPAHDGNIIVIAGNDVFKVSDENEGEELWRVEYENVGGSLNSYLNNCLATDDGGYLLSGTTAQIGNGGDDFYAAKVDSAGEIEWENAYGIEDVDFCSGLASTSDGGWCLAGSSRFGENRSDRYALIVRINSEGELIWQYLYDEFDSGDFLVDIIETPDGGFAAAGEMRGHGLRFILRIDCNGEVLWRWRGLFDHGEDANAILRLDDGGYLLAGYSPRYGCVLIRTEPDPVELPMELAVSDTLLDFGVLDVDSIACRELRVTNPGRCLSRPDSVIIAQCPDVFTLDHEPFELFYPWDTLTVSVSFTPRADSLYMGLLEVWLNGEVLEVALSGSGYVNSVADSNFTPSSFVLYPAFPNPFNATTTISYSLPAASQVSLKVFDLSGREVKSLAEGYMEAGNHAVSLSGESMASGVYLVRMKAGEREQVRKMVLVR